MKGALPISQRAFVKILEFTRGKHRMGLLDQFMYLHRCALIRLCQRPRQLASLPDPMEPAIVHVSLVMGSTAPPAPDAFKWLKTIDFDGLCQQQGPAAGSPASLSPPTGPIEALASLEATQRC